MLTIGHRGAAGHEFENSLAAIERGLAFGVDAIEIDVQRTRDGKFIAFHDNLLDRVSNGTGFVRDYTFAEIRKNVRLNNGDIIPSLAEVLALFEENESSIIVEMKASDGVSDLVQELDVTLPRDRFVVASFQHQLLIQAKQTFGSDLKTLSLLEGSPIDISKIIHDTQCNILGLGIESVNAETVSRAKACGVLVFLWTVNDPREIDIAFSLGVDGIFSDFPDRVIDAGKKNSNIQ